MLADVREAIAVGFTMLKIDITETDNAFSLSHIRSEPT